MRSRERSKVKKSGLDPPGLKPIAAETLIHLQAIASGKRRELRVRLRLIPVHDRGNVILQRKVL
jgi:hypothetical protein